eukprot:GFUD01134043.1.p1 GENE.GFUD01134043.1~~GFUD01134043.1.p1  ORF type:complete len:110 (-),score=6.96 GFUD01134043.1:109-438(-)
MQKALRNLLSRVVTMKVNTQKQIGQQYLENRKVSSDGLIDILNILHGSSQVVEGLFQLLARLPVKTLPDQEGQLVGVLTGGGDPHSPWPVVVQMGQLVRQLLEMVRLQS